jgi:hypothetical protein
MLVLISCETAIIKTTTALIIMGPLKKAATSKNRPFPHLGFFQCNLITQIENLAFILISD